MQHLCVHLLYEDKVGEPVQYRWMNHIERALKYLKAIVGNKARVEGCIIETFLLKEITYCIIQCIFCGGTQCQCSYNVIEC
jgi:hypothetical protein